MVSINIPKQLVKLGQFSLKEALANGLTRRKLQRLLIEGDVERVSHGLYQVISVSLQGNTIFSVACKIAGFPSAICFWSALNFYNLTDEIDRETWVMVPSDRRRSNKNIRLVRFKRPQWDIGISKEEGYWITTIERTIIDSLSHPSLVGTMASSRAVKKALDNGVTNISKLVEMASKLGCLKKVYTRLEVFIE